MATSYEGPTGSAETMPSQGTCVRCGMETTLATDGRVACSGCGYPTDRCTCEGGGPAKSPGL